MDDLNSIKALWEEQCSSDNSWYRIAENMKDYCLKLEQERNELKAWKEEAIQVMNRFQLQEIGKELELPLGSDIPSQILPEIKRIKAITDEAILLLASKDKLYKAALEEITKLKTK